jgi:hypothetical protein
MIQCFGSALRCDRSLWNKYYLNNLNCKTFLRNVQLCSLRLYISSSDMFINKALHISEFRFTKAPILKDSQASSL